jgi:hypothetical protein
MVRPGRFVDPTVYHLWSVNVGYKDRFVGKRCISVPIMRPAETGPLPYLILDLRAEPQPVRSDTKTPQAFLARVQIERDPAEWAAQANQAAHEPPSGHVS